MAIQQEIWKKDITKHLASDNQFAQHCVDASGEVLGGAVVHIPNAGSPAGTTKNRSTFPATIVDRTDTDVVYPLDAYYGDPMRVEEIEKAELSYNKRQSIIEDNTGSLKDDIHDDLLYHWTKNLPSTHVIAATGTVAVNIDLGAGAVSVYGLVENDLMSLRTLLDQDKVPMSDRFILLDSWNEGTLAADLKANKRDFEIGSIDLANGVIGKLHGFTILKRPKAVVINAAGTSTMPFDATLTTDNLPGVVAWQKRFVEKALGTIKLFDNPGKAEYYGDVMSTLVRMGGRGRRSDHKGIRVIKMVKTSA